jgi:hypothetical protein
MKAIAILDAVPILVLVVPFKLITIPVPIHGFGRGVVPVTIPVHIAIIVAVHLLVAITAALALLGINGDERECQHRRQHDADR